MSLLIDHIIEPWTHITHDFTGDNMDLVAIYTFSVCTRARSLALSFSLDISSYSSDPDYSWWKFILCLSEFEGKKKTKQKIIGIYDMINTIQLDMCRCVQMNLESEGKTNTILKKIKNVENLTNIKNFLLNKIEI